MRHVPFVLLLLTAALHAESPPDLRTRKTGSDWPTFLGPTRDGVSPEKGILTRWPREGLKVVWEVPMGLGFAAPVVSKGRVFHFDRFGDDNRLSCRTAETGKLLWKFEYPTDYRDLYGYSPGPRACPMVDDDRVYVYGPEGMLHCLTVADGKVAWSIDTVKEYHVHQNFFGVGSVPAVEGDLLIVAVGGSPKGPRPADLRDAKGNGTGIIAFDKRTGKEVYRITDELASYSSPVLTTIDGRRWCFYFARGGLVGFEPKTGNVDFHFPWRSKDHDSVNASNPVVVGDKVLLTECYGPGAALLKVKPGKCEAVWTDKDKDERRDKSLRCHWNTPIHADGYVYGSSGRHENEAELRCVELSTGKVAWSEPNLSRCSLTLIDGHFLCLTERGELILVKVNPAKYEPVAKWVMELDHPSWASPVVSNGLLYVRGKDRLICAELIPEKN
ncbi:MAG TPA: PQQ-binding-like beta-propeller repeat protein [Gemmataceae bacterium]|nr:PQQ-binding-like beta-propeller repeat protein [Gemmataceae bacterium]